MWYTHHWLWARGLHNLTLGISYDGYVHTHQGHSGTAPPSGNRKSDFLTLLGADPAVSTRGRKFCNGTVLLIMMI